MAPVHDAARRNDVQALRALLDAAPWLIEADSYSYHYEFQRPLHIACRTGSMEAVQLLLERGANIAARNASGMTPLLCACEGGHVEVVALLMERGADPTLRSRSGRTALMYAAEGHAHAGSDHVAVIRLLLKDGRVPVDAKDGVEGCFRRTALYHACYGGHAERARVLLVEGRADSDTAKDIKQMARFAACEEAGRNKCISLIDSFEGEMKKAYLLSKARAVVDATESISKALEKVRAKTWGEMQRARQEAAPVYLRGRVKDLRPLPLGVEVGPAGVGDDKRVKELRAVHEFIVRHLSEDLFVELLQGLRYR